MNELVGAPNLISFLRMSNLDKNIIVSSQKFKHFKKLHFLLVVTLKNLFIYLHTLRMESRKNLLIPSNLFNFEIITFISCRFFIFSLKFPP